MRDNIGDGFLAEGQDDDEHHQHVEYGIVFFEKDFTAVERNNGLPVFFEDRENSVDSCAVVGETVTVFLMKVVFFGEDDEVVLGYQE